MSVDTASSGTSSFYTSTAHSSAYPSEQDLSRLARALRSAARDRGLPEQVTERYEAWVYLFLGWCLKAPPGQVHRDRVGDFWTALTRRQVPRWKVCEAMDAVGFLFGALGGPAGLSFPGSTSLERNDTASTSRRAPRKNPYRPNPTLHASSPKKETSPDRSSRDLSIYLPEGQLPMGVDARASVPTAESSRAQASAPASSENSDSREDFDSRKGSDSPEERASRGSPSGPRTLFNPEGFDPEGSADAEDRKATSPETVYPQDDPPKGKSSPRGKDSPKSHQDGAGGATAQKKAQSGHVSPTKTSAPPEEAAVSFPVPEPVAERVRKAARQLGLPPQVFVARALDLVCDETGVERPESPVSEAPVERYQTQLDVLHLGERSGPSGPEAAGERDGRGESQGTGEPRDQSSSPGKNSSHEKGGSPGKDGSVRERRFLSL